jgi:5-methylcytosine-specific restriction endonuclease McrA
MSSQNTKRFYSRLIDAQRRVCPVCGNRLRIKSDFSDARHPLFPTVDHVWPKSMGYKHSGNLLVTHRRCNEGKADRLPTGCELVWLAAVNARLAA